MRHRWMIIWISWTLIAGFAGPAAMAGDNRGGGQPDRPWIIKRQSPHPSPAPAPPPAQIEPAWSSPEQAHACPQMLNALENSFRKAQHYSIQGDSCRTAEEASRFLDLVERCRVECPQGFLEQNELKPEIIRNLGVLKRLGEERCPQKK
jgi:hypothetical protein